MVMVSVPRVDCFTASAGMASKQNGLVLQVLLKRPARVHGSMIPYQVQQAFDASTILPMALT